MFCVMGTIQLITWPVLTLGRAARRILGDTGLENVRDLNCRPRYKYHVKSPRGVSGNSQFFSKYLKNIWLHFINSTVKTRKITLSPEMATQISGNDDLVYSIQQNSKQLHIKSALFQYPSASKKTRALQFNTGRVRERPLGAGGLKRS